MPGNNAIYSIDSNDDTARVYRLRGPNDLTGVLVGWIDYRGTCSKGFGELPKSERIKARESVGLDNS